MTGLLIASAIAFLSAFLGGLLTIMGKSFGKERLKLTSGFSAGLLITIALAHMLPESDLENNYLYAVLGFGIFYLIQGFTASGSCRDAHCEEEHPSGGLIAWTGMSFHALVDGLAMGVGFSTSPDLGLLIALAILIHKAPIGFSLTSILRSRGYRTGQILPLLLVFAALTPSGAILSGFTVGMERSLLNAALAFSGGTFLHISVSDLLPRAHAERNRTIILYVLLGIVVGLLPKLL